MPAQIRTLTETIQEAVKGSWSAQTSKEITWIIEQIEKGGIMNLASASKRYALVPLEAEDPAAQDLAVVDSKAKKVVIVEASATDTIEFMADPWTSKHIKMLATGKPFPPERIEDLVEAIESELD